MVRIDILWIVIVLACGCGRDRPQSTVTGEVAFSRQPVSAGMISFEPTGTTAPPRTTSIRYGKYSITAGQGIPSGEYLVRIMAPDLSKPSHVLMEGGIPDAVTYPSLLSPAWNTQSHLVVAIKQGRNILHFRGEAGQDPIVEIETPAR